MAPPPANGSWKAGSRSGSNSSAARGWSAWSAQVRRQLVRISARACANTVSFVVFSHCTNCSMRRNNRCRSCACASRAGEQVRARRGIVHELGEEHRPRRRQVAAAPTIGGGVRWDVP